MHVKASFCLEDHLSHLGHCFLIASCGKSHRPRVFLQSIIKLFLSGHSTRSLVVLIRYSERFTLFLHLESVTYVMIILRDFFTSNFQSVRSSSSSFRPRDWWWRRGLCHPRPSSFLCTLLMRGDTPLSLRSVLPTVSVGPSGSASCSAPWSAQRVSTWSQFKKLSSVFVIWALACCSGH